LIERFLGLLTTCVIAISPKQREDICERYRIVSGAKTVVIQNGFELESMSVEKRRELRYKLRLSDEQFAFLWAGRMVPIKDIHLLAETIRLAVSHVPEAVFLIAGDGEQKSELEQLLRACPNVRMLGWQEDMHALSCAADAAILTSRNEGTPTVLIEAMAAKHPFVSTNVGGVEDLAVGPVLAIPGIGWRGENGFLSHRKASALLACIEQLVNDRAMAERMGAIGQEFVTNTFSAARLINDISVLYEELLRKRQKRGIQLSTEEDPVKEQAMT
jgi:glycosyltransferase involved in cell wall biosynthesis